MGKLLEIIRTLYFVLSVNFMQERKTPSEVLRTGKRRVFILLLVYARHEALCNNTIFIARGNNAYLRRPFHDLAQLANDKLNIIISAIWILPGFGARTMRPDVRRRLSRFNVAEAVHLRGEWSEPLTCSKYFSNNLHGVISISIKRSNAERVADRSPIFLHYSEI